MGIILRESWDVIYCTCIDVKYPVALKSGRLCADMGVDIVDGVDIIIERCWCECI